MFFIKNLIQLNYFDLMTITLTIVTMVAIQIINTLYGLTNEKNVHMTTKSKTTTTTTTTTALQQMTSGKIQKQSSEQSENNGTCCTNDNKLLDSATVSAFNVTPKSSLISTSSTSSSSPSSSSASASLSATFVRECEREPERERDYKSDCNHEHAHERHSVNLPLSFNNWNITLANSATDNLNDEYHDDEDAISLENLFPGDQSEIWQSKKISYIIDELIETENNYVNQLRRGCSNYGTKLQQHKSIPNHLKGSDKQQQLLGNIDEILLLHEHHVYPCMLRYKNNLQIMFDELSDYIENNFFYCYVSFMINKKASTQLWQENRSWFQMYQSEIKDKLGIDSFLVQPIQRLTKYPLLLKQLITEFYGLKCKSVLSSLCKLETRMRRLLELVNQAEQLSNIEDFTISEVMLNRLGHFRRSGEFEAYHHRSRKKFQCKVLLFDNVIISVEHRKKQRLIFRHQYNWSDIVLKVNSNKSLTLLVKATNGATVSAKTTTTTAIITEAAAGMTVPDATVNASTVKATTMPAFKSSNELEHLKEEYDFMALESLTHWLRWARKIMAIQQQKSLQSTTISIHMHIVLGVAFAIWFIWQYL